MSKYGPDNYRGLPEYLDNEVPEGVTRVIVMAPATNFSGDALNALMDDAEVRNATQAHPAPTSINTFHAGPATPSSSQSVPGVTKNSAFFSACERAGKGTWNHFEVPFGQVYKHFLAMQPHVLVTHVTPKFWGTDAKGKTGWFYGLGLGNDYTQILAEMGVPVWGVVNSNLPSTPSGTNWISADCVVGETITTAPIHYVESRESTDEERRAAKHVARRVKLIRQAELAKWRKRRAKRGKKCGKRHVPKMLHQWGVGGFSLALQAELYAQGVDPDGIQGEAIGNSVIQYALRNPKAVIKAAIGFGTKQFVDLVNGNPNFEFHPVHLINSPKWMSRVWCFNQGMAPLVTAAVLLSVGNENGRVVHSGIGGYCETVRGALHSFVFAPATRRKKLADGTRVEVCNVRATAQPFDTFANTAPDCPEYLATGEGCERMWAGYGEDEDPSSDVNGPFDGTTRSREKRVLNRLTPMRYRPALLVDVIAAGDLESDYQLPQDAASEYALAGG